MFFLEFFHYLSQVSSSDFALIKNDCVCSGDLNQQNELSLDKLDISDKPSNPNPIADSRTTTSSTQEVKKHPLSTIKDKK